MVSILLDLCPITSFIRNSFSLVKACVQCPIAVLSWSFHSLSSSMTSRKALMSSKLAECHSRGGFVELFIHIILPSAETDLLQKQFFHLMQWIKKISDCVPEHSMLFTCDPAYVHRQARNSHACTLHAHSNTHVQTYLNKKNNNNNKKNLTMYDAL